MDTLHVEKGAIWTAAVLPAAPGCRTIDRVAARSAAPDRHTIDHITVHHTATGAWAGGERVDIALVAGWHRRRGIGAGFGDEGDCAYHFLILPDGTVQHGRPLNLVGGGTRSGLDNSTGIAVALVGDFSSASNPGSKRWPARPTARQLKALDRLALWAFGTYGFGPRRVLGHREVAASGCPGDRVDMGPIRRRLEACRRAGDRGLAPPDVRSAPAEGTALSTARRKAG